MLKLKGEKKQYISMVVALGVMVAIATALVLLGINTLMKVKYFM